MLGGKTVKVLPGRQDEVHFCVATGFSPVSSLDVDQDISPAGTYTRVGMLREEQHGKKELFRGALEDKKHDRHIP